MGALGAWIGVLMTAAVPANAGGVHRWRPYVEEASARFGVPAGWVERVMFIESRGRTELNGKPITSPAGAMGLMQLMPGTWADMRDRLGLGSDPYHPRDNILAGTYYLKLMHARFGYPGLFAAYNAGPRRYAEHLATGRRLPGETRAYLASVAVAGTTAARASDARLFFLHAVRLRVRNAGHDLFVPLGGSPEPIPVDSTDPF
jgi:soluble lytic murein transglycosylase-like protein